MSKSYPPKSTYSEDRIPAPRGFCAPKFLRALENDQVLLVHTRPGTKVTFTIFIGGQELA